MIPYYYDEYDRLQYGYDPRGGGVGGGGGLYASGVDTLPKYKPKDSVRKTPHKPTEYQKDTPVAWRVLSGDVSLEGKEQWIYYDTSDFKNGIDPTSIFPKLQPLYLKP